jgi:hypothetical protein
MSLTLQLPDQWCQTGVLVEISSEKERAFDAFIPKNLCNECAAIGKRITREDQSDLFLCGITPDDPASMIRKASGRGGAYFFAGYCSASLAASR